MHWISSKSMHMERKSSSWRFCETWLWLCRTVFYEVLAHSVSRCQICLKTQTFKTSHKAAKERYKIRCYIHSCWMPNNQIHFSKSILLLLFIWVSLPNWVTPNTIPSIYLKEWHRCSFVRWKVLFCEASYWFTREGNSNHIGEFRICQSGAKRAKQRETVKQREDGRTHNEKLTARSWCLLKTLAAVSEPWVFAFSDLYQLLQYSLLHALCLSEFFHPNQFCVCTKATKFILISAD